MFLVLVYRVYVQFIDFISKWRVLLGCTPAKLWPLYSKLKRDQLFKKEIDWCSHYWKAHKSVVGVTLELLQPGKSEDYNNERSEIQQCR